jgi:uncharacterized protein
MALQNPFRSTDRFPRRMLGRAEERRRVARALTEPQGKLLIVAPRRMGKSSVIHAAAADAREVGAPVVIADLAGISCVTDVASRILRAAAEELTPCWTDALPELVKRLGARVSLAAEESTGRILPSVDPALRRATLEEQHALLRRALDALDEIARAHDTRLGLVLEEIQQLFRLGGSSADWALAGAARQHAQLGYALTATDDPTAASSVTERAALSLFETRQLAPLPRDQFATWIDEQLRMAGIKPQRTGDSIVDVAYPRTGNVVQLAAYCFDHVRSSGFARAEDVERAFTTAVTDSAEVTRVLWDSLTTHQQNVLRAVSVRSSGLTTTATRERFSLGDTGTTHNSAQLLVRKGLLERVDGGYVFESPFVRGWVIANALGDVGLTIPITHHSPPRMPREH